MNKNTTSIVLSVLYLHAILAFFAYPRITARYKKIFANLFDVTPEEVLNHWSYNVHIYILAVAAIVLLLSAVKQVKGYTLLTIASIGLTINLALTVYYIKRLF